VIEAYADRLEDEIIQNQIQRWQADPFLAELVAINQQATETNPINSGWITLGHQPRKRQEVAR